MTLSLIISIWFNFLGPFNIRRNRRDCAAMLNRVNYDGPCTCSGYGPIGVEITCDVADGEKICFGSTEEPQYCATMDVYRISSERRNQNRFSTIAIDYENIRFKNNDHWWILEFVYANTTASISFDSCTLGLSNTTYYNSCACSVCDSGIDFKYDCSAWGGPKTNETCTSIRSLTPTNPN